MASYEHGKNEVCKWIKDNFPKGSTCLDVGACDGVWANRLNDYLVMDGVEIFEPYLEKYNLSEKYRNIYVSDIEDFEYKYYDIIIFGDVIEHMSVEKAQRVLEYAKSRCKDLIIAVPFKYPQEPYNDNIYEAHIQDDLTEEIFAERYQGFETLVWFWNYCYYHKGENAQ